MIVQNKGKRMNLSELGKLVVSYGAPLLGAVVAGPSGAGLGKVIANEFGGSIADDISLTDLVNKLNKNPDTRAKLEQIESDHKLELQKIIIQESTKNTVDARRFTEATKTIFPQILSAIIVFGFFVCIYWIAAFKQDADDHEALYLLFGVVGTSFAHVVNFWLGSSFNQSPKYSPKEIS